MQPGGAPGKDAVAEWGGRHGLHLPGGRARGARCGQECHRAPVLIQRVQRGLCAHHRPPPLPACCGHERPRARPPDPGFSTHQRLPCQHTAGKLPVSAVRQQGRGDANPLYLPSSGPTSRNSTRHPGPPSLKPSQEAARLCASEFQRCLMVV